jgi:hypothetical protein
VSIRVRRTLLKLAIEYLLLTFPILLYVSIEAIHHSDPKYLITSPEWSIATIFVLLQTYRLYSEEMKSVIGQRFGHFLVIILAMFAAGAAINIYLGMDNILVPSWPVVFTKWGLLLVSTALFVYVAGAAIYATEGEMP